MSSITLNGDNDELDEACRTEADDLDPEVVQRIEAYRAELRDRQVSGVGPPSANLPDDFWAAHTVLEQIRAAARDRMVSPDTVLGVLLARTAGFLTPERLRVDTGVDDRTSLNLIVASIGPPGVSKSQSATLGHRLLPAVEFPHARLGNIGSGEGIAEAFMGVREVGTGEEAKNHRPVTERGQVRTSAFLEADEGELLTKLGERSGSTLGTTLRSAFSGAPLGQLNATKERQRDVRDYALGLAISFQPETARPLFKEAAQGTPQRLLYFSAIDPLMPPPPPVQEAAFGESASAPTPSCDALAARLVANVRKAVTAPAMEPTQTTIIAFPPGVAHEVRIRRHHAHTGALAGENPLDGHCMLLRLKVAALLAILLGEIRPGRNVISERMWHLAGQLVDTSCAVRDDLVRQAREAERKCREDAKELHADREVHADAARHAAKVERMAKRVRKYTAAAGAEGLLLRGRGGLIQRFDGRERGLLDEAIDHAADAGWIRIDQEEGRVYAGM
ncbi:hypothetical protein GCM10010420_10820 [Streptomyces glaucosporus]|uniref:DUF3987 domain-containing protein n=1 Tax=Streptomyces glaucosporus TaxID=284044 RepID=A0ABN3HVV5_9ACTN